MDDIQELTEEKVPLKMDLKSVRSRVEIIAELIVQAKSFQSMVMDHALAIGIHSAFEGFFNKSEIVDLLSYLNRLAHLNYTKNGSIGRSLAANDAYELILSLAYDLLNHQYPEVPGLVLPIGTIVPAPMGHSIIDVGRVVWFDSGRFMLIRGFNEYIVELITDDKVRINRDRAMKYQKQQAEKENRRGRESRMSASDNAVTSYITGYPSLNSDSLYQLYNSTTNSQE
jgi:hypothetical protein